MDYTIGEENVEQKSHVSFSKLILSCLLIALSIINFTSVLTFVPTASMANEIEPNDILYASKIPYIIGDPDRFDIIVFKYPLDRKTLYIKRVIGLPGDHVEIQDGHIYINGEGPIKEEYLPEKWTRYNDNYVFDVPESSYLVLGDNRNYSFDARFWREEAIEENICEEEILAEQYAYVKRSSIEGKAITKLSPYFEVLE